MPRMNTKITRLLAASPSLVLLLVALLLAACAGASEPAAPTAAPTVELSEAASAGRVLFTAHCAACHSLSPDTVIVGPPLAGIGTRAGERVPGLAATEYLEESILHPDAYKVPGFEDQQMPTTLAKELTVEEIDALVAYLTTLR